MRNPDPVTAGANPTIDVYFPWTPSEMMAIMATIPDRKKSPAAFVDSLRTTISIYQADSRDLWALVQQILTPAEYRNYLNHLNYASHAALQQAYALDDDRRTQILNALNSTFQRPINLSVILDLKPKKTEEPEEFLERFNEIYRGQSGDLLYQNGQNSPQYCAMLMHCLPPSVVTAVKCNNMNWTENDPSQMARAVIFYWKEGVGQEGGSVTKVKTEYVMKKDDLRPQQAAEMVVYQQEPQYSDFGWVDQRRGGYQTHPKGPSPPFYGPPNESTALQPQPPLRGHWSTGRRGRGRNRGSNACFNCGRVDHWQQECPFKRQAVEGDYPTQRRGYPPRGGQMRYTDFSQENPFPTQD
ncbi:uncharacterized protein [Scyliorhinus torazame]|uniref:uncharacterized protein isoform X1 n=1 Tax=Scyliorhinus torazame TaxID=75743 RepID=UPI003B592A92